MAEASQKPPVPDWLRAALALIAALQLSIVIMIVLTGLANETITNVSAAVTAGMVLQASINLAKEVYSYVFGGSASGDRKAELLAQSPPPSEPPPAGMQVTETKTTTPAVAAVSPAAPDDVRLADMIQRYDAMPAGAERDKLAADIDALKAKPKS